MANNIDSPRLETNHFDSFIKNSNMANVLATKETKMDLISVELSTTLENTLEIMKKYDIVSVVVQENGNFVTLVDVMDIIDHVIFIPYVRYIRESNGSFGKFHFTGETIKSLLKNRKHEKPVFTVSPDTSLANVVQYFSSFGKYHRGIVIGPNCPATIFSQTDIIKYLFENMNKLGDLVNQRLEDLNLANPYGTTPRHVSVDEPAFQAFLQLSLEGINALAVVDSNGQIVGNVSASDLRGISSSKLPDLKKTVYEYCKESGGGYVPITVTSKTSFGEVLLKLARSKPHIHRVWIINPSQQPIGVVTMSDIISIFAGVAPTS